MKIATKLTLMITLLIALSGAASSAFVYYYESRRIETEAKAGMAGMAGRMFDSINSFLFERSSDIKSFATSGRVASEKYSTAEMTARLLEYRDFYKCYDSLAVFDLNRVRIADTAGVNIGRQHSLSEYWLDPLVDKDVVLYPAYSETVNAPVIYFSYPVENAEKKVFRIMVSRILISKLGEIVKLRGENPFEEPVDVDLIEKDGTLIYSSHEPQNILKGRSHFWVAAENIIKGQKQPGPFFFEEDSGGAEVGGKNLVFVLPQPAYLDFEGEGWFLAIHLPLKIAMAPAAALRNYMAVITLFFISMAAVCAFLISRAILAPLVILQGVTAQIGMGNFDVEIDAGLKGEIGDLARGFKNMARQIKVSREEMIDLLHDLANSKRTLEEYAKTLEAKVGERTEELKKSMEEVNESHAVLSSILEDTVAARDNLETALGNLRQKEAELVQSGKLAGIGQLAAGIAHEINNPLTCILGYAQITLAHKELSPQIKNDLQNIEKESKRCVTIIENLMNFARPTPSEKTGVNLNNVIEASLKLMEYAIAREQIKIVRRFDKDLPPVTADPFQMQQVFMNITINAVHAMQDGGTLTIATGVTSDDVKSRGDHVALRERRATSDGQSVCVSFTDTGVGIPDDIKDKIFEPFFTTSYERGHKGAGLGLSISHTIIDEHGGRIEVESEKGKGSTFRVILPVA